MLNNTLKKIWRSWGLLDILYFIYLFFFFCPDYFQIAFVKWMNYGLMAMAGLILYIRNYKPGKIAQLSLLFMGVGLGLSFFHHLPNANLMLVLRALRQLMLVFYTDYMLRYNRDYVIRSFFYVLVFWVGMSILSVFAFPKGLYVEYDSNKWDKWIYSVNWLYGHKNNHALTFMLFQLFVWLAYEYKQVSLNVKGLCFLGILPLVASLIMRSVTTCAATLLVSLALILGFRLWKKELPKLRLDYTLGACLGLAIIYTVLSLGAVKQLIGFDYNALLSLNGRNYIWTHVLRLVPEHLFFGIGLIDFDTSMKLLGGKSFLHAHNTFIDILWKGGLFYLPFFFYLIYRVCAAISRVIDRRIYNILVLCFLALLVELCMESYLQEGKLFLLLLLLTYIAEDKQDIAC